MIPFEAFHYKKPSISHLQPFGRKCFIYIPEERCLPGSKLILRAEEGIFLGYTNTPCIYKVYILACCHTFIVSALDIKCKDASVIVNFRPVAEVTMAELTTMDVPMPDVNSASSTTAILISFARLIIHSMTVSAKKKEHPDARAKRPDAGLRPGHLMHQVLS